MLDGRLDRVARRLRPMSASHPLVSIILPTYNESANIRQSVQAVIEAVGEPVEVIVVDDDSPDQTWRVVADMGDARVKAIRRSTRGLASAIARGLMESKGEIVGWMDADLSMPVDRLPLMIERLEQAPVVIGSRYVGDGADDRTAFRVLTSRLINGFARLILGGPVRDLDSGFIVLRRSVFDQVRLLPIGYGAYFIDLLHACRMKGIPVLEVPYRLVDRQRGTSKSMPNLWQFALHGLGYVLTIFYARVRRHP